MISVAVGNWTERVLDQGTLETPEDRWKIDAYEEYKASVCKPDYPCFFGQSGELRGEMLYTFVARNGFDELAKSMRQFVNLIGTSPYERASLIAFFEPDPSITDHMSFVARFWQALQFLHGYDEKAAMDRTARSSSVGILLSGLRDVRCWSVTNLSATPQQEPRSGYGAGVPAQISFHRSNDRAADRGARPASYSPANADL